MNLIKIRSPEGPYEFAVPAQLYLFVILNFRTSIEFQLLG